MKPRFRNINTGCTSSALCYFQARKHLLGNVSRVTLCLRDMKEWTTSNGERVPFMSLSYRVYLQGEHANMSLSGFAWGYGGTGPQGLITVMRELGFIVALDDVSGLDNTTRNKRHIFQK